MLSVTRDSFSVDERPRGARVDTAEVTGACGACGGAATTGDGASGAGDRSRGGLRLITVSHVFQIKENHPGKLQAFSSI